MSELTAPFPYRERNDALFLEEMNALTVHHLSGSKEYSKIWPKWEKVDSIDKLPFLHVGLFKHLDLKTTHDQIIHERTLHSSSTTGVCSKIAMDKLSSTLQNKSTQFILQDFLGHEKRPLLLIESAKSLYKRGGLSARIAAALSLKSLSQEIYFLLDFPENPESMKWNVLANVLDQNKNLLIYGFTWLLWVTWGREKFPNEISDRLKGKKIFFVHSGGWKKLESIKVSRREFNETLLYGLHEESKVIDFYGLVEQIGVIYPLCEYGYRHVPVWADVIIRNSYTLESIVNQAGQLQLLNTLAWGAPYHSVLTEDLGRIVPGPCKCGRLGKKFELLGRVPRAELRGCANV